jgi:hypothetical protein
MLSENINDFSLEKKIETKEENYQSNFTVFSFKDAKPSKGNSEFIFKKFFNSDKNKISTLLSFLDYKEFIILKYLNKTTYRKINKNIVKDFILRTNLSDISRKNFWFYNLPVKKIIDETKKQEDINYNISSGDLFNLILERAKNKELENSQFRSIMGEISRDLNRTFHTGIFLTDEGITKLKNNLNAVAYERPEVNYCQGMNFVAGGLLTFFEEDFSFWIFLILLDEYELNSLYSKVIL